MYTNTHIHSLVLSSTPTLSPWSCLLQTRILWPKTFTVSFLFNTCLPFSSKPLLPPYIDCSPQFSSTWLSSHLFQPQPFFSSILHFFLEFFSQSLGTTLLSILLLPTSWPLPQYTSIPDHSPNTFLTTSTNHSPNTFLTTPLSQCPTHLIREL